MAETKRFVRIHLHCDNLYDHIPDGTWVVPFEEGLHPLKGEPFGRDVAGGDNIKSIQIEGNDVIFNGQRYCLENGKAVVNAKFMYYKGIVPNPLFYTITLSLLTAEALIRIRAFDDRYDAVTEIPYVDGNYTLSGCEYPVCRLGSFLVQGDTVTVCGVISKLWNATLQGKATVPLNDTLNVQISKVYP